jgi:RNA polymerase sigma-70 factor, ECF subfamily
VTAAYNDSGAAPPVLELMRAATSPAPGLTHSARTTRPTVRGAAAPPADRVPSGSPPTDDGQQPVEYFSYAELDNDVDRELLWRISSADREAFQQLYLRYHQRLSRFLIRVTRHHADVEDVINEALLIVWQRAGQFRDMARVSTWIFGIAYRCALKGIRRSAVQLTAISRMSEGGATFAEDAAQATEDRQLVELGLARLSLEHRLVVVLAYYMDYSCEEIAAIADCPANTVKTRLFYARRRLGAFLADAGVRCARS